MPKAVPKTKAKPECETALYAPVKRFLEAQGFSVKGEVCGCDLVALRGDGPPVVVIGELKLKFNLELGGSCANTSAATAIRCRAASQKCRS
jgi:hypothetical protein